MAFNSTTREVIMDPILALFFIDKYTITSRIRVQRVSNSRYTTNRSDLQRVTSGVVSVNNQITYTLKFKTSNIELKIGAAGESMHLQPHDLQACIRAQMAIQRPGGLSEYSKLPDQHRPSRAKDAAG